MYVNIKRAIKNIGKVDFFQPLYEAIVNSFQAKADKVEIFFEKDDNDFITLYSVQDNGEGFTDKNLESYLTLWSDLKADIGGLGSGRLLCLKVFDNIHIESQTKKYKVEFNFNKDFNIINIDDFNKQNNISKNTYTITKFENINEDFLSENGMYHYNSREIKENIFIKLMPMFIKFKEENKNFQIFIDTEKWLDNESLQKQFDDLNFETKEFRIEKDLSKFEYKNDKSNNIEYLFKLYYRLQETKNMNKKDELIQFYGASDRYITSFPNGVKIEKLPNGWSGIFCLTSNYFEENRVADSRNKFIIGLGDNNSASKENPITFPEINQQLSIMLESILKEKFPKIEQEAKKIRKNIVDKFPHLLRYVKKVDGLTLSENQIQKKAEEAFFKETKKTRQEVENFTKSIKEGKKFNEKRFNEITNHFTQTGVEQLADYVGYRQTIIEMLLEIYDDSVNKKRKIDEKDIHNLFMPMGKTNNDLSFHANNIWIFDDKFMSYTYAASDKTIAKIVSDVTGKNINKIEAYQKNKEPDLVIFYSDEESKYKDVLLIEFKKLNGTIDDKEKAINQIIRYPRYIRENIDNIRSIYTYTILDIDKELEDGLTKEHGFSENAFGDKDNKISAYYKYNSAVKAHINVLSFSQLIEDAFKRNEIFLDILKQNFEG